MKKQNEDNPKLEDMISALDPPYESKEELKIGQMLDRYGLPFFYRQPTIIFVQGKNKIWRPTFTLPTYDSLVIDYIARPEGQDSQPPIQQTKQVYEQNQIPAILLSQPNLNYPNWQPTLYDKLNRISRQLPGQALYNNR